MLEYIGAVLETVLVMLLLIGFGFLLYRKQLIDDHSADQISAILVRIISPVLIIISYQKAFTWKLASLLGAAFMFNLIAFGIIILIARLAYPKSKDDWQAFRMCSIFPNNAFMAFPLLQALFGDMGIFLGSASVVLSTLLLWTYGSLILAKEKQSFSLRGVLVNPGVIAFVGGMLLFISPIKLPSIALSALSYVGNLNTPLAMIILGAYLAKSNILSAFKSARNFLFAILKMIVVPAIIMIVLFILPIGDPDTKIIVLVGAACPTGVSIPMIAQMYGHNPIKYSHLVTITTLFSIITLPIILSVFRFMLS